MDLGRGWDQSEATWRRIARLDTVVGTHQAGEWVSMGHLFTSLDRAAREAVLGDVRVFEAEGWIRVLAWTFDEEELDCEVLAAGVDFLARIRGRAKSRSGRRAAVRDAVLYWIDDEVDNLPMLEDFLASSKAIYYGSRFEESDLTQASSWLKAGGYIEGQGAWGAWVLRPKITAKGMYITERGLSVNDDASDQGKPSVSFTNHFHEAVGAVAQNSPGTQHNVTMTISDDHRTQVLKYADRLEQALPALGLSADAGAMPNQLRDAADRREPGSIRRILEGIATNLGGSGALVLSGPLALEAHHLIQLLGR